MSSTTTLSSDQILTLIIIEASINTLSLVGSLFIVCVYFRFKKLRSFAFFLITLLCFSDSIRAFTGIMSLFRLEEAYQNLQLDPGIICQSQAFLLNWSGLSVIIFSDLIFWMLYSATIRKKVYSERDRWKYAVIVYSISLGASVLPITLGKYGPVGQKCWIALLDANGSKDLYTNLVLTLIEYYIPLWFSMLFITFGTTLLIKYVRTHMGGNQDRFVNRLLWYPVTLIVCWTFPTINRVYSALTGEQLYWMQIMHVSLAGFQGFLNALVYGMTDSVRQELHNSWCPCIPLPRAVSAEPKAESLEFLKARLSFDGTQKVVELNTTEHRNHDQKANSEPQNNSYVPSNTENIL